MTSYYRNVRSSPISKRCLSLFLKEFFPKGNFPPALMKENSPKTFSFTTICKSLLLPRSPNSFGCFINEFSSGLLSFPENGWKSSFPYTLLELQSKRLTGLSKFYYLKTFSICGIRPSDYFKRFHISRGNK